MLLGVRLSPEHLPAVLPLIFVLYSLIQTSASCCLVRLNAAVAFPVLLIERTLQP